MRKVLIPTDFSENAMNAIRYALEVFKYERSEFFIIHAYADEVYEENALMTRTLFEEIKERIKKTSRKKLDKILEKVKQTSPNPRHKYATKLSFGTLIDKANEIVDKENIDVLVMGTRGETDDRDITFGSNTLQVLKYVKCPVLAIPSDFSNNPPKDILFPTDYLLPYKRRELKLLSTLAKSFIAEINFLHLINFDKLSFRQEDNKAFLECTMEQNKIKFHRLKGNNLIKAINHFIENNKINMLVMVNSRHSFLEDILYQSTIDKIGLHIKIPFLVLQNLPR